MTAPNDPHLTGEFPAPADPQPARDLASIADGLQRAARDAGIALDRVLAQTARAIEDMAPWFRVVIRRLSFAFVRRPPAPPRRRKANGRLRSRRELRDIRRQHARIARQRARRGSR